MDSPSTATPATGSFLLEWSLFSTLLRAQSRSWASAPTLRLCSSRLCPLAAQSPQTLSSVSTQGVHWVLPVSPSLSCRLETVSRQFAEEIPGLPSHLAGIDLTSVPCITRRILNPWTIREVPAHLTLDRPYFNCSTASYSWWLLYCRSS